MTEREPSSLHETILSDIEANILSGLWPPGHRIPPEQELVKEYGCARMTVNKAMTQLARAGLIQRRRKTGSIVMVQKSQNAILEIHDVREEVLALGLRYRFEILDRVKRRVFPRERERTGLAARQDVLAVRCRHFADETPFCLEERIINLAAVPEAAGEIFATLSPGPWLIQHVPWSAAEHEIGAAGADAETARRLDLAEGEPCLVIERQTWRLGKVVTQVRFTYPGTRHRLRARFTPSHS